MSLVAGREAARMGGGSQGGAHFVGEPQAARELLSAWFSLGGRVSLGFAALFSAALFSFVRVVAACFSAALFSFERVAAAFFSAALFSFVRVVAALFSAALFSFVRVVAAFFSAALFSFERVAAALFWAALFSFERVAAALFSAALFSLVRVRLLFSQPPRCSHSCESQLPCSRSPCRRSRPPGRYRSTPAKLTGLGGGSDCRPAMIHGR